MLQLHELLLTGLGALVILVTLKLWFSYQTSFSRFPPGPPSDPIIGHARKISLQHPWETFAEWGKTHGDVVSSHVFGRTTVILNSFAAARDLLNRKSAIYSERPPMPLLTHMGWELATTILPYSTRLRKHRRIMYKYFNSQAISEPLFKAAQTIQLHKFLYDLCDRPDSFLNDLHGMISRMIALIVYGHEVTSEDDLYIGLVERASKMTIQAGVPGMTLLDFLPILRYVPAWFPGASLQRHALETRKVVKEVMEAPYNEVKSKKAAGIALPSMVLDLLIEYEKTGVVDEDHEDDIKSLCATVYTAGEDTTKSVISTFFLMMTLHPDVAKQAQEEIDRNIGLDRLPTLDDRPDLPYIDCILKEVYRFAPPVTLGLPHMSLQADNYRSWFIPKKTTVIANIWKIMRDEQVFPEPEAFRPERHAGKFTSGITIGHDDETMGEAADDIGANDPSAIVFGFGRRICPGRAFADATVWLTIANVLATFDIRPYINPANGKELPPEAAYDNGFVITPTPFKCTIVPRSETHAQLVTETNELRI